MLTPQNKYSLSSLANNISNAEDGIVNHPVPYMLSLHPSFLPDFSTFLTAKKKCTESTKSQAEGGLVTSDTADNVNITDAEDRHAKGIVFLACNVHQLITFGSGTKKKKATLGNLSLQAVDADTAGDVNMIDAEDTHVKYIVSLACNICQLITFG